MNDGVSPFKQLVADARQGGYRRVVVRRAGHTDIVFYGALVATAHLEPGESEGLFEDHFYWTDLSLFVLRSGRFAIVRERLSDLRRVKREVEIANGSDLARSLGHSELAKILCERAGIDATEPLEEGSSAAEEAEAGLAANSGNSAGIPREAQHIANRSMAGPMELPTLALCNADELAQRIEKLKAHDSRDSERVQTLLEAVAQRGVMRPLAQADEAMLDELQALGARFPNLAQVVEFVRRQVRLALRTWRRVLRLPPVLLVGAPGTGKTRLLEELATILRVGFTVIDCGVLTASFVIAGGDQSWNGSKAGRVFDTLASGQTLNPLVLLDELDKLDGERRYDPYGPLHTLLERHSARRFSDEFAKVAVDASYVMWFATANRTEAIPASILSRLRSFEIRPPTNAEMAAVVRSVYADLAEDEELAGVLSPELAAETIAALSAMTPRAVRDALSEAMARASWENATDGEGRVVVLPAHVAAVGGRSTDRKAIGFTAGDHETHRSAV